MIAYCYRSGQIDLAKGRSRVPSGSIAIGVAAPKAILTQALDGVARLAYDNETWLVPGVPEAKDEAAAYHALEAFDRRLSARIGDLR